MKGQVFILIALVVFIVVAAIKIEAGVLGSIGKSESESRLLPDKVFPNIRSELVYAADLGAGRAQTTGNINNYVSNFTDFIKGEEDVEIAYFISNFNPGTLNITVANFLGQSITQVSVKENQTGSSTSIASISDESSNTTTISTNPGTERTVEINVSFVATDSTVYNESFYTKIGPDFNYTTVYYDFKLNSDGTFLSDRFQANKRS